MDDLNFVPTQPQPPDGMARGLSAAMQYAGNKLKPFGDSVGGYWADSNAQFEQYSPSVGLRFLRNVNPVTGFGATLGRLHTAAGQGDLPSSAMAAFGAVPTNFGLSGLASYAGGALFGAGAQHQRASPERLTSFEPRTAPPVPPQQAPQFPRQPLISSQPVPDQLQAGLRQAMQQRRN